MSSDEFPESSVVLWSLASWFAVGLLHFFILQFVADSRTRDYVVSLTKINFGCSHYMSSVFHLLVLFGWSFSAWAIWLRGGFLDRSAILIAYFFVLVIELLAYILFWDRQWMKIGAAALFFKSFYTLVVMIATAVHSAAAALLLPYLLFSLAQSFNYWKFALSNRGTVFKKTLPGRLRERATKLNANAFFAHETQDPEGQIISVPGEEESAELGSFEDLE